MAPPQTDKKKRKRGRKARTDVSSTSSSSDSESSASSLAEQQKKQETRRSNIDGALNGRSPVEAESTPEDLPEDLPSRAPEDPEQLFDDFYLKQATKEFANDLDKLRSAGDFGESSVSILVDALKQGRACFTAAERRKVSRVQG